LPTIEHVDGQLCGKPIAPLPTWTPVILSVIYSLARNPSSQGVPNSTDANYCRSNRIFGVGF
jgi:hypothetical protein